MDLTNEFEVGVPVEQAWAVLTDVERIAPCLPGAQLQEVDGDEYRGVVKVKVGPITAQYKGTASFIEKDDDAHVAKLKADGRDTRGNGNANAVITATLVAVDGGTKVTVDTDLQITGKVAQFGRGVLADVSAKLLGQFVENLETTVLADEAGGGTTGTETPPAGADEAATGAPASAAPAADAGKGTGPVDTPTPPPAAASGPRRIDHPETEPVDLFDTAGAPVAKRLLPTIAAVVVLVLIVRWLRSRGD
jgi:carbon monoxide dehydrogenase subunit G